MTEKLAIDQQEDREDSYYKPFGWQHWPQYPWMSYEFRRGLGETQEGMGSVSESFLAASRMIPGDKESWRREWLVVADANQARGDAERAKGHIRTAMNCWLRAAGYYRQAEFWLEWDDPRRLMTFSKMEACTSKFLTGLNPPGEIVHIPYENGTSLSGYFLRAPFDTGPQPCLIAMGGLDSIKDEMWAMQGHSCLQRGISVLMIDGPGQGSALHRYKLLTRYDYEVPVSACVDYLETRADVRHDQIAVCGSSLGGYYAARAGSFEHRLAGTISHGATWSVAKSWEGADEDHGMATHIRAIFGAKTVKEALEKAKPFTLDGVLENMKCPYLIVHGGFDVLGVRQATQTYEYAKSKGVDVTFRLLTEEETGAEHCQHDNPTLGQEIMADWLADLFQIDQVALYRARHTQASLMRP